MRFVHVNGYASNLFTHCCCYTALCCMNAPQVNDPFYYGCAFRLFPVVCFVVVVFFCHDNALLWYLKLLAKIISFTSLPLHYGVERNKPGGGSYCVSLSQSGSNRHGESETRT